MVGYLVNDYPENWDETRKKVYRRDHWTCQKCGASNVELHAHHIEPLSAGGTNELDNLITFCKKCHMNEHPHMWINLIKSWLLLIIIGIFISYELYDWFKFKFLIFVLIVIIVLIMRYSIKHKIPKKSG